jgi:hypothetical protein
MDAERWARVKDLFHAALDREPHQGDTFLAEACRDDADPQGFAPKSIVCWQRTHHPHVCTIY